ncbi:Sister chromatid cohesion protein pds5 [Mycena venus]|uniref:Sister chromatid cohesion protein pds5 n=1 Tax=Mycena venus TaxID=2733690 RepID=A0A8H6Y0H7_9AGAR|nr:Sister chromatid cohesion protein pds5 [Mycena venus]
MVAQTRHAAAPSPQKLAFRDKLVGKGLSTDLLIKKLQVLHRELADLEQELVDVNSLGAVRKELINSSILLHKDRGVKAYAACCLADILRLTAPDAPYTQGELRDIFQFFFRQLTNGLKGSDSPYYTEYFHLLESLSTVKSVVLVCDLQNADELMVEIFRDFFQLVRRDLAKKIEMFLSDILVALIDECQVLPGEVLDTIMAQFMDKNARLDQPAYRLAVQVCNSTADKLTRHVSQYFTEIIVAERSDDDLSEIRTAHALIQRLYASCPALLPTVIPQLEEELQAEDLPLRLLVTQVLGEMYAADKGAGLELMRQHPSTWNVWLKRKTDKAPQVRLKFVEATRALLSSPAELRDPVEEALTQKLLDPDDKVRAAVCRVYAGLDYETALHHVKVEQLRGVAERGADKKQSVRMEALHALGKLFSLAYPEIENKDTAAILQFAWIPNEVLKICKVTTEVRPVVEDVVAEYLLPLPSSSTPSTSKSANAGEVDEAAWTDRLLTIMAYLDDEQAFNMLFKLSAVQRARPTIFDHFVESCIANNGGVIDENEEAITTKLAAVIKYISGSSADPHKTSEDLHAFAKLNEQRLYKLFKTCMELQTDLKSLVKATNEFAKRIETLSAGIAPTMNTIVRQASLRIFNQSSIPTLIKRVQKSNSLADNAQRLLTFVSKHQPGLYKSHIGELVKGVADEKHPRLVEVALQALAAVVRWDGKVAPTDKRTLERIKRLALEGTHRQAKFAARFLAFSKNKATDCMEVVDTISEALSTAPPEVLVAHVAVLAQFARFAPDAFEHKSDVLTTFLVKELLMVPTHALDDDTMDTEEEWADESDVSDNLRAKILALKVCRNRSLAHAKKENALEIATPVLKMLATLLECGGSFIADSGEDPKVMSRMRLQAAVSLLHLSTVPAYSKAIAPRFLKLAIVVQDTCFDVRMTFLKKLVTLASAQKVPTHYNVIPFLTVHDPEPDVKSLAVSYVQGLMRKYAPAKRVEHLEMMFIRLLHLLGHHPDFAMSQDEMLDIAKYIQFYLSQVANADTISLLYHLALKGKTVRDAESKQHTENLYVISELAQELIKIWGHTHSLNIATYPGKVKLPPDILRPLPDSETSNQIVKTVYLNEEMLAWVKEQYAPAKEKKEKEKKERAAAKRKAPAPSKTNGNQTKRRRKRYSGHSDDDDGTELTDEDVDMDAKSEVALPADDDEEEDEPSGEEEKTWQGAADAGKEKNKPGPPEKQNLAQPLVQKGDHLFLFAYYSVFSIITSLFF